MNHFEYRNGVLCAEDVPLPLLAEAVGTPFYCYSTATLTRHYQVFAAALPKSALIAFSVKANGNLAVVKTLDTPFREAHKKAAQAVAKAESRGVALDALPLGDLKKIEPRLSKDVYKVLSLEASVRARQSDGGPAPNRVAEQIGYWKARLKERS